MTFKKRVRDRLDLTDLLARSAAGQSYQSIADSYGVSKTTVASFLRFHGHYGSRARWANQHANYKNGRHVTKDGYVWILIGPDHPFADMRNVQGYVREHRLVMAKHLGRSLTRSETVHHLDGNRSNNRLENLQLRVGTHGPGVVYVCASCGSVDVKPVPLAEPPIREVVG